MSVKITIQCVLLKKNTYKRKKNLNSYLNKPIWLTQVWKLTSVCHQNSLLLFTHCLLMSQRQNSLLMTENDANDGKSCNGFLLARVNCIIMKLFQWCCYFKWTLKNWLFWGLKSVGLWLPVDSVGVLMVLTFVSNAFQYHNVGISDETGYSTWKYTNVLKFGSVQY